jgi:hypothetical protein
MLSHRGAASTAALRLCIVGAVMPCALLLEALTLRDNNPIEMVCQELAASVAWVAAAALLLHQHTFSFHRSTHASCD